MKRYPKSRFEHYGNLKPETRLAHPRRMFCIISNFLKMKMTFIYNPGFTPGEIKHSGYFIWSLESLDKVVFDKSSSLMLVFFVRDLCDSEEKLR